MVLWVVGVAFVAFAENRIGKVIVQVGIGLVIAFMVIIGIGAAIESFVSWIKRKVYSRSHAK